MNIPLEPGSPLLYITRIEVCVCIAEQTRVHPKLQLSKEERACRPAASPSTSIDSTCLTSHVVVSACRYEKERREGTRAAMDGAGEQLMLDNGSRHTEHHFTAGEVVRDVIMGVSDGLTVPFALAAGLSGASAPSSLVLTAGLAEVAAGAISMGLGGYVRTARATILFPVIRSEN